MADPTTANMLTTTPSTRTAKKQSHFRLLDLPPELVVRVLDFAVVISSEENPIQIEESDIEQVRQPAITRTCRLLRDEGLPKFYARNVFRGDSTRAGAEFLWAWLAAIGHIHWKFIEKVWVQWSLSPDDFHPPAAPDQHIRDEFEDELRFLLCSMQTTASTLCGSAAIRTSRGKIWLKCFGSFCYQVSLKTRPVASGDWKLSETARDLFGLEEDVWFSEID